MTSGWYQDLGAQQLKNTKKLLLVLLGHVAFNCHISPGQNSEYIILTSEDHFIVEPCNL